MSLVPVQNNHGWDLTTSNWSLMKEQAAMLVKSGFLPSSIKTPEQAIAIMLKGRELGIPPMQAFSQIAIINGKPSLGAELMLARVYERHPEADIQIVKRDSDGCLIKARRNKKKDYADFSFQVEDAKRADVLGKDSWKKYPKAMYFWRAVSDMVRSIWPECLAGVSHTPEELGAEVDEEGNVTAIDVKVQPPKVTSTPPAPVSPVDSEIVTFQNKTREEKNVLWKIATDEGITEILKLKDLAIACVGLEFSQLSAAVREWKSQQPPKET